jgi:predicted Zn-dependent peptidase
MRCLRVALLASCLWAQTKLIYADSVLSVYVYQLSNGLTVVVSPNAAEPRAFVMIATRAGSKHDPPNNTGLAHYLEHLLFKGTDRYGTLNYQQEKPYLDAIEALYEIYNQTTDSLKRLSIYKAIDSVAQLAAAWAIPNEYDRMVSALGAQGTNAFTTTDVTAYINDVPAHHVEALLRLEAERFRKPVLRLFHTELEAVYEEKNISIDNENQELHEKLRAALFPDHPYGTQTPIGTIEHLKNPSIRAIRRYYESYYVPNNMVVIVAGDVRPQEVVQWVERYFGAYQPKPVPPFPYQKGAPSPLKKPVRVEAVGPDAPYVEIAFRIPPAGTREALMARIADQILSNSVAGLLDEMLVQTRKVKSANSYVVLYPDHGMQVLFAEPRVGGTLEETEKLLFSVVEALRKGQFDESLITAAINDLDFSQQESWRSNRARAQRLLTLFAAQIPWKEGLSEIAQMRTITKAELLAFLKKYYDPKRCVIAYKRQGERPPLPKVPKPPITPLSINREATSPYASQFLKEVQNTPPPQPSFVDFTQAFERAMVKGRVNLYAIRNTDDSLFTLIWYLPQGSWHEKWLPLLFSYLDQVGPQGQSLKAFKRRLFLLGARLSFNVSELESYVVLKGLQRNFLPAVQLVDSLLHGPAVDEEVWKFIRQNTLKNRQDAKKNPAIIGRMLSLYGLYGPQHPQTYIPSQAELENTQAAALVSKIQSLWQYPWELYYDGPASGAEVAKALEGVLHIPPSWRPPQAPQQFEMQETPAKKAYFVHFPMVRAEMTWLFRSEKYRDDLRALAALFTEYFGGGMSGVVFQQIREAKGLAYSTRGFFAAPRSPQLHYYAMGYVGTQADKLLDAYVAMESLWDSLKIEPPLVDLAKQSLLAQMTTERLRHEEVFQGYWTARRFGKTTEIRAEVYKALPDIQAAHLERFYQQYVQGRPRLLLLVGDRSRLDLQSLKNQGLEIKELSLEEIFGY